MMINTIINSMMVKPATRLAKNLFIAHPDFPYLGRQVYRFRTGGLITTTSGQSWRTLSLSALVYYICTINHILLGTEMTTSELFRRDPPKGKKEFSAHKGFTIIELMVVIAVVAIITSLALPSYRTLIEKRQVTSGAQQIAAFLSSAQLEAVRRNEPVAVDYFHNQDPDDPEWCMGMVVGDAECDCSGDPGSCSVDGTLRVMTMDNLNYAEAVVGTLGDGGFVIDPVRGMMTDFTDLPTIQFLSKPENTYALNVVMSPTGRVSICSDAERAGTAVPGFDEC